MIFARLRLTTPTSVFPRLTLSGRSSLFFPASASYQSPSKPTRNPRLCAPATRVRTTSKSGLLKPFLLYCRGVYFVMVMELDLNVTDPAVNRRDVEQMIPTFCWMYLRHHSFQLNSTVFVNRTTFGIKVCSGYREVKLPRRLRQLKRH